jgi:transcriptional regulator with XRE-family HTH domain
VKNRNEQYLKMFGENLKKILKSKNLKPSDLAAYSDMETKQIYRILNGEHSASIATLYNIAEGLELPIKELFEF